MQNSKVELRADDTDRSLARLLVPIASRDSVCACHVFVCAGCDPSLPPPLPSDTRVIMFAAAHLVIVFFVLLLALLRSCNVQGQTLSPRIVRTKQGSVKGVLVIPSNRDLQPVEAFLGLPFAAPPVGALRFMPPVSPLPWNGVRLMDKYGPACPQTLPDVSNEREALRFVTRGRLQYLRRLLPYLRNQSEDCLYLNIYAPVTGTHLLVRLHTKNEKLFVQESFAQSISFAQ